MTKKTINAANVDEELWRKFVGLCKIKGTEVGPELERVLRRHITANNLKV